MTARWMEWRDSTRSTVQRLCLECFFTQYMARSTKHVGEVQQILNKMLPFDNIYMWIYPLIHVFNWIQFNRSFLWPYAQIWYKHLVRHAVQRKTVSWRCHIMKKSKEPWRSFRKSFKRCSPCFGPWPHTWCSTLGNRRSDLWFYCLCKIILIYDSL